MKELLYSNERVDTLPNEVIAKAMLLGNRMIREWEEGGYKFQISEIDPRQIGATVRYYELLQNGEPAYGGRYHDTIRHAEEQAHFTAEGSMHAQITYLWSLVDKYRKDRIDDHVAMDCALEYIDNTNGKGADGTRELLRQRLGLTGE